MFVFRVGEASGPLGCKGYSYDVVSGWMVRAMSMPFPPKNPITTRI